MPTGNATEHWELFRLLSQDRLSHHLPTVRTGAEAKLARILVDADLCDRNLISFKEFNARVLETIANRWTPP
jgi:hypothetical protein